MENLKEKYIDILREAKSLFWKHGIKKVTVEEICSKAGTSRVTFYKYFENKEKLALSILMELVEEGMSEYYKIMNEQIDYPSKIEKIIAFKIRRSDELSKELLKDLYGSDFPEIQNYFQKASAENLLIFQKDLQKAQEEGNIRNDIKVEFIMYILNKMMEMIRDDGLVSLYGNAGKLITEFTRFFFYGVVHRKND